MTTASVGVLVEGRKLGVVARVSIENSAKLNTLDSHLMIALIGELGALARTAAVRGKHRRGNGTGLASGRASCRARRTRRRRRATPGRAARGRAAGGTPAKETDPRLGGHDPQSGGSGRN